MDVFVFIMIAFLILVINRLFNFPCMDEEKEIFLFVLLLWLLLVLVLLMMLMMFCDGKCCISSATKKVKIGNELEGEKGRRDGKVYALLLGMSIFSSV